MIPEIDNKTSAFHFHHHQEHIYRLRIFNRTHRFDLYFKHMANLFINYYIVKLEFNGSTVFQKILNLIQFKLKIDVFHTNVSVIVMIGLQIQIHIVGFKADRTILI